MFLPYRLSIETAITDTGFDIIKGTYRWHLTRFQKQLTRFTERQIEFHPDDENLGELFGDEAHSLKGCVHMDAPCSTTGWTDLRTSAGLSGFTY